MQGHSQRMMAPWGCTILCFRTLVRCRGNCGAPLMEAAAAPGSSGVSSSRDSSTAAAAAAVVATAVVTAGVAAAVVAAVGQQQSSCSCCCCRCCCCCCCCRKLLSCKIACCGTSHVPAGLPDLHQTLRRGAVQVVARLLADAEQYTGGDVKKAVISVPAYFQEAQVQATIAAGAGQAEGAGQPATAATTCCAWELRGTASALSTPACAVWLLQARIHAVAAQPCQHASNSVHQGSWPLLHAAMATTCTRTARPPLHGRRC